MEVRKLSELKATNPYLRLGTDVTELEKSIQTLGLIAPLVISTDNVILAGARRYQALLNLGYTEAPVMVVDRNALERELVSIDENLVRKDLSNIEMESHLRRAKEIYQEIHPEPEPEAEVQSSKEAASVEILPAEKFLHMVSEKTGLSPKQIHQAIKRDELASSEVKEARRNGELSLSQTNEIVKLNKEEQQTALDHVKELPIREIKKFVKLAKVNGVSEAIKSTPHKPFQREFLEIDSSLKKILKKLKQLQLEGFEFSDFPQETQKLVNELQHMWEENNLRTQVKYNSQEADQIQ